MTSASSRFEPRQQLACGLALLAVLPLERAAPGTALWAAPAILLAAMLIAWAAEAAQFFIAQAFALAILAWLQRFRSSPWSLFSPGGSAWTCCLPT